jgi:hypothetical protein
MPSASKTMAMAVMKGVLKSARMANLRLRTRASDEPGTVALTGSGVTRGFVW